MSSTLHREYYVWCLQHRRYEEECRDALIASLRSDVELARDLLHVASDYWFDSSKVMGRAMTDGGKAVLDAKWHDAAYTFIERHGGDPLKKASRALEGDRP
jgi:hypothetical protein